MRVFEVAQEFNIEGEKLLQLLHAMGVRAGSQASNVPDATIAKLRARFERERRAGHGDAVETIESVIEDKLATAPKRRRRRKADVEAEAQAAAEAEAEREEAAAAAAAAAEAEAGAAPGLVWLDDEEEALEVEEPAVAEAVAELETKVEAEAASEAEAEAAAVPETEAEEAVEVHAVEAEEVAEEEVAEEEVAEEEVEVEVAAAEVEEPVADETELAEAVEEPSAPAPARKVPAAARPRLRRAAEVLGKIPAARQAPPAPAASAGPGGQVRIQAEGFTPDGRKKKDKRKKKGRVDQGAVQENVARVMTELRKGGKKRRHRREEAPGRVEVEAERKRRALEEATIVRVNEFLTVAELSELIDVGPSAIVGSAFKNLGLLITINQRLDFDQIELLCEEFGFRALREEEYAADVTSEEVVDQPEDLQPRPPIVTVMGHVDHGKTSLLDYIRKTNVIAGESGGITQHVGAYGVKLVDGRAITFLDTPGHAAFTAMRARGAELTDIVILVVAADDSVMPQTIEAISHARNAGVPMIVAINKIDLPGADPERIRQDLLQHQVVVEEFGGDVLSTPVSAKKGTGVPELLDKVLLQSEMLDLTANPDREAHATVVEAQLDVGKGPVATVLVVNGTLRVGDSFVCGHYDGKVRALLDERGRAIDEAGPGSPAVVLGIAGVPQAGDVLMAMEADRASEIAQRRQRLEREKQLRIKGRGVKLTDISRLLAQGEQAHLNLIIKGDVDGSVQALADALGQLSNAEVEISVIHRGVGAINESDILLASTSGAIIIGFHVRPGADARALAVQEGVDIRLYNIIYEAIEDVSSALEGLLQPEEREVLLGEAEVRQIFRVPRIGTVAGCYVSEGIIGRRGRVRLVRDGVQVYEGELGSLKRFKDDVREVREGFECGLSIEGFNDVKVGDRIECYRTESVARTLAEAATTPSS